MSGATSTELTALEHLHELSRRLMWSVAFLLIGGIVAYFFRLKITQFLQKPLHQTLYYTSPMGSFQFIMQVCLLCGFILALPAMLYNILRFIEPAFAKNFSRKMIILVLASSLLLAFVGTAFAYYVTLPVALSFFSSVGTSELHPLISVNEYFSFILGYLATFALVFQLPLILLFINTIKPIDPSSLGKYRKIVYIGAFAISLIMPSSPDPLSQISLAIPIIILYELSIVLIKMAQHKNRKVSKMAKAEVAATNNLVGELKTEPETDTFAAQLATQPTTTAAINRLKQTRSVDGFARRTTVKPTQVRPNRTATAARSIKPESFQTGLPGQQPVRLISDIL